MQFGFCGPSYPSQSVNADCQKALNWYPEKIESGTGKTHVAMYPTPGLAIFTTLDGGPVRGQYIINDRYFAVSAASLYEVFSDGTKIVRGTVVNDFLPVSMVSSSNRGTPGQLLLASGGTAYVLNLTSNVLTPIPPATFTGKVAQVSFSDGFFEALVDSSERFYVSAALDATNWVANGATVISVYPDDTTSLLVDHRELWLFGRKATVVYYNSGNVFPYDVVPGGTIEQGCVARFSPVKIDNSIVWLGGDERGAAIVWRAQGYVPQRVSNHAIEAAIQSYSKISDAVGYAYQDQGHSFYVLYFPTPGKTWVLDVEMGAQGWHERDFLDPSTGNSVAHHSQNHVFAFGKHLVGDWASGNIYQMSISLLDNAGAPIRRVRRAPHISNEQEWGFHHSLQIDCESGLGTLPPMPGDMPATTFTLADANGGLWRVGINDVGSLTTTSVSSGSTATIYLNDPTKTTSWLLGVTTLGALTIVAAALVPAYQTVYQMVSYTGVSLFDVGVTNIGVLQTQLVGAINRGPLLMLRWSDDGGHTWSNEYRMDTGKIGEFKKRAIRRRLGRTRDRVYEVSATDPVPWRLLNAYLKAS